MKRSKKCFGLLLALPIMLGLSLSVYSNTNALKHEYMSVPLFQYQIPHKYKIENGTTVVDWSALSHQSDFQGAQQFMLEIKGNSYDSEYYNDLKYSHNFIHIKTPFTVAGGSFTKCTYNGLEPILNYAGGNSLSFNAGKEIFDIRTPNFNYAKCHYNSPFNQEPQLPFDNTTIPSLGFYSAGLDTGAKSGENINPLVSSILPYSFSANGFYTRSTSIDTSSGIHYNNSFDFTQMFNKPIKSFSYMQLPLWSYDNYWTNASNFYAGRHFEFQGVFQFDESVTINPSSNTSFKLHTILYNPATSSPVQDSVDCTALVRDLTPPDSPAIHEMEYTCSYDMPFSSPYFFPALRFNSYNSQEYFWQTNGNWRFSNRYVTTDYDDTIGEKFGANLLGNDIAGEAQNSGSEEDWFSSLLNIFNFNAIFPMSSLYTMFSDRPCVDIPILASMIHAEQTTYCAWFDSNTRNIVTPVMSIASTMLIFGFFVRWLKGSSSEAVVFDEEIK